MNAPIVWQYSVRVKEERITFGHTSAPTKIERNIKQRIDSAFCGTNQNLVSVFILGTGDKYLVLALDDRRRPPPRLAGKGTFLRIAEHIKNIFDPDGKRWRWRGEDTRRARADDTLSFSLPLGFLPPCVTDLADVGLHIFNHFFLKSHSRSVPFSLALFPFLFRYLSPKRTCRVFLLRLHLSFSLPSFPELIPERVRISPRKVDIFVRKKKRKKRVFVTRCTRVASGPRANEAASNVWSAATARRTTERKGVSKGKGRELEVKQRRGKWKPRICVRGASERVKLDGVERRVVSPGKWKFDDGSAQRRKRESEAHPYYMRVPHERRAKSTSNLLTEVNRKKNPHDLSRHAADLRYLEKRQVSNGSRTRAKYRATSMEILRISIEKSTTLQRST